MNRWLHAANTRTQGRRSGWSKKRHSRKAFVISYLAVEPLVAPGCASPRAPAHDRFFALCTTGSGASIANTGESGSEGIRQGAAAAAGRISSLACYRRHGLPVLSPSADVPPALAAFLRGSERRAWVFLWLQGGQAEAADQALAAATRAFQAEAARLPMAQWPGRYWRLLSACPLESPDGEWSGDLAVLATAAPQDRRALLLRLAAGLDEQPAADALGVALDTYRQRLAAACPRDAAGAVDAGAWHRLAQAIQQAARDLPDARLERIAELRDTALSGHGMPVADTAGAEPLPPHDAHRVPAPRRRRPGPLPLALIVLVAVAAATAWWLLRPSGAVLPPLSGQDAVEVDDLRVHDRGPILVEPLPDADPPAVAADPMPPPMAEPPADPVVAQMDFLSWYAAGAPDSRIEREADSDGAMQPVAAPVPDGPAVPAAQAWAQLRPFEQASLRRRFGALDRMERRGWAFGPDLGRDWPGLQPWLGFVPEEERAPLLAVLRAMDSPQRALLAELLRRQSPAGRVDLRRELVVVPAPRRASWLEEASLR